MAKRVRRHTPQQRIATIFGGIVVLILIVVLVGSVIQGSRRTSSDSVVQRVLSARVEALEFISDTVTVDNGTVYLTGHYAGVPANTPETQDEWQQLFDEIIDVYAKDLSGVADRVHLELYYEDELQVEGTQEV